MSVNPPRPSEWTLQMLPNEVNPGYMPKHDFSVPVMTPEAASGRALARVKIRRELENIKTFWSGGVITPRHRAPETVFGMDVAADPSLPPTDIDPQFKLRLALIRAFERDLPIGRHRWDGEHTFVETGQVRLLEEPTPRYTRTY